MKTASVSTYAVSIEPQLQSICQVPIHDAPPALNAIRTALQSTSQQVYSMRIVFSRLEARLTSKA